jgi:alginate O-acetyltransferase complex protein AlgI
VYFGLILIIEKLWLLRRLENLPKAAGHIYSLIMIVIGWVIFAIDDLGQVADYIGMMLGSSGSAFDDAFFYFIQTRWILFAGCVIGSTPLPAALGRWITGKLNAYPAIAGLAETGFLLAVMIVSVAFLVSGSYNPFLYFRF